MLYVDTMRLCDECINCKYAGRIHVGDAWGGGPDDAYECDAGRNMSPRSWGIEEKCSSFDSGFFNDEDVDVAVDVDDVDVDVDDEDHDVDVDVDDQYW
jgi:hypothetical protein